MEESQKKLECRFNLAILPELFMEAEDLEEKKDLMKNSPFYKLCFPSRKDILKKSTTNTFLFARIADLYDTSNKMFCLNGVWMSLCVKEVGDLLGLPFVGNRIPKATRVRSVNLPKYFTDRCTHDEEKKNRYRNHILMVLKSMRINTDADKLDYKRFINLYIITFVVKVVTSSLCSHADIALCENLENFNSINWSQEILAVLEDFLQTYKKNVKENKRMTQIGCMGPLLEAWFCMRTNIGGTSLEDEDLPIFKYHGSCSVQTPADWTDHITQLTSDKILNCQQDGECSSRERQFQSFGNFRVSRTVHERVANHMLEDIAADFLKFSLKPVMEKHGISDIDTVIQMGREHLRVSEGSWELLLASAKEGCQILMANKSSQQNPSHSMDKNLEGSTEKVSLESPQQTIDLDSCVSVEPPQKIMDLPQQTMDLVSFDSVEPTQKTMDSPQQSMDLDPCVSVEPPQQSTNLDSCASLEQQTMDLDDRSKDVNLENHQGLRDEGSSPQPDEDDLNDGDGKRRNQAEMLKDSESCIGDKGIGKRIRKKTEFYSPSVGHKNENLGNPTKKPTQQNTSSSMDENLENPPKKPKDQLCRKRGKKK